MTTRIALALLCAGFLAGIALRPRPATPSCPPLDAGTNPGVLQSAASPAGSRAPRKPDPCADVGSPGRAPDPAAARAAAMPSTANEAETPLREESEDSPMPDSAWLGAWEKFHSELLAQSGSREEAGVRLRDALQHSFQSYAVGQADALAGLDPAERSVSLAELEEELVARAQRIFEHLGVDADEHLPVLDASREAISAEVQYAGLEGTHEKRLAMLRLDQEREARVEQLITATGRGPAAAPQIETEIESWYEDQLRRVIGVEETD